MALNPNRTVAPGWMRALCASLRAVSTAPAWLAVASQASRSFWSPVKANRAVQPLTAAVPVFLMSSWPVKPLPPGQVPKSV